MPDWKIRIQMAFGISRTCMISVPHRSSIVTSSPKILDFMFWIGKASDDLSISDTYSHLRDERVHRTRVVQEQVNHSKPSSVMGSCYWRSLVVGSALISKHKMRRKPSSLIGLMIAIEVTDWISWWRMMMMREATRGWRG